MAHWLQAQLNVAQNLLESVDRTISKSVGINADGAPEGGVANPTSHEMKPDVSLPTHPAPHSPQPPLSAPEPNATPFTIRQSGPFDDPGASASRHPHLTQPLGKTEASNIPSSSSTQSNSAPGPAIQPSASPLDHDSVARSQQQTSGSSATLSPGPSSVTAGHWTARPLHTVTPASSSEPPPGSSSPSLFAPTEQQRPHHSETPPAASSTPAAIHENMPPAAPPAPPAPAGPAAPEPLPPARPPPGSINSSSTPAAPSSSVSAGAVKLVEQLRKRLELAQAENEQLEDLLKKEEQRAAAEAAAALRLAEELSALQDARAQSEAALQSQLAASQLAAREATARLDMSSRQVLKLEAQVTTLEETTRQVTESRSGLEGGMVEALKSQLEAAEKRLDAERRAHQATKAGAMAREHDLEGRLTGTSGALSDMQRQLDEAGIKSRDLEDQVALLESACKQLEAKLSAQDQQPLTFRRPGVSSAGGSDHVDESLVDALRTDLSQQQRARQAAEQGKAAAEAQLERAAVELEGLRAELEKQAARGDISALEGRLREVTDMLYLKQNQLERLSADKAAQLLRLERKLQQERDEALSLRQQQALVSGRLDRGGPGDEMIPMDALGAPYQRLAQHNQVGKAVKAAARFLDSTASSTVFFLRQYPLARLIIFSYLVFIHLYIYYLMARLQGIAVRLEAAVDMGDAGVNSLAATKLFQHDLGA